MNSNCLQYKAFKSKLKSVLKERLQFEEIKLEVESQQKTNSIDISKKMLRILESPSTIENFKYRFEDINILIEKLESSYTPIQTYSFLSFALVGKWKHKFTNYIKSKDNEKMYLL
jgi:hypothetical protein